MRLSITLLIFGSCISFSTYSDELTESLENCNKNQYTLNVCAHHSFEVVDRKLNELFKIKLLQLKTEETIKHFREAQRAWVAFRDKDCLYQVPTRDGSRTDWPMLSWSCMKEHTEFRVKQLEQFIECTYDNCPR
jgi:uncharacterized protein YecT (DUF1311 family)